MEQHFADAADDPTANPLRALADRRIQAVLRRHPVANARRAQAHATDAPAAAGMRERIVGVDSLMRAMKGADAEMNDADAGIADRVSRRCDVGRQAIER